MDREKITLTGARETLLATLYGRALDSRSPDPVLGDTEAERAVRRIDYDFRRTGITATTAAGVALRARQLDDWTAEFLAARPDATVLHLACGLDTRVHRLERPPSVRWFDVDYPEVVELRERLLPVPEGDYRMIGSSVTGDGWLAEVPGDRPVVAVFEGLTMYLRKEEGRRLIQRITGHFPGGQLLFDCYGTMGIRMQKLVPAVRNAGATLHWGVDDPSEIEGWHEGLECLDALRSVDMPGLDRLPAAGRVQMWIVARIPGLRDIGRILRYRF
ncbi:class I SAM-dependent methyltransferase [Planomonospora venezuelensis]|uniref:O-methyltransferase involved in polyketide biosynthesis n=1 Tax=Planomonospora venezuelensis TaxID=1999 RepID=A0A841CU79_PLAVE|nr:class I SAM-dependent methyltransferase [Planomonospora venezuelensis]MBB5960890.1 O-methyltransferase involved in polyketide biosynthesis [Planomonospora venezuelensis]GIN01125.1 putative polyketide synthase protein [Planomonospora venezuelensis]